MWTKRGNARLIFLSSVNTNCKNMAYRSSRSEKCSARGVRKVTTGITSFEVDKVGGLTITLATRLYPTLVPTHISLSGPTCAGRVARALAGWCVEARRISLYDGTALHTASPGEM